MQERSDYNLYTLLAGGFPADRGGRCIHAG